MSAYLDLADGSHAPIDHPDEGDDSLQWLLRYSEPTRGQRLHAAAILAARAAQEAQG
jgi:hypothetical protein